MVGVRFRLALSGLSFALFLIFPGVRAEQQAPLTRPEGEKPKKVYTNKDIEKDRQTAVADPAPDAVVESRTPVGSKPEPDVKVSEKTMKKVDSWFLPSFGSDQRKLLQDTAKAYQLYLDEGDRYDEMVGRVWRPAKEAYDSARTEAQRRAAAERLRAACTQLNGISRNLVVRKRAVNDRLAEAAQRKVLMPSMASGVLDPRSKTASADNGQ